MDDINRGEDVATKTWDIDKLCQRGESQCLLLLGARPIVDGTPPWHDGRS